MKTAKSDSSARIVAIGVIVAIALMAFFEIGAALCAPPAVFLVYGLVWTLLLLPLLVSRPSPAKFGIYVVFIIALIVLYIVPWNSRKVFLRDLEKIKIGMTIDEVETTMGNYIKGTGWPAAPGSASSNGQLIAVGSGIVLPTSTTADGELAIQDSITYRHTNDGAFDSDWGIVTFKEGKVVAKAFLPD